MRRRHDVHSSMVMPKKHSLALLSMLAACGADDDAPSELTTSCEAQTFPANNAPGDPPEPDDLVLEGCVAEGQWLDVAPHLSGLQVECVATELDGAAIPHCDDATGLPCWHVRAPAAWEAAAGCAHMAIVEREAWTSELAVLRCACE